MIFHPNLIENKRCIDDMKDLVSRVRQCLGQIITIGHKKRDDLMAIPFRALLVKLLRMIIQPFLFDQIRDD